MGLLGQGGGAPTRLSTALRTTAAAAVATADVAGPTPLPPVVTPGKAAAVAELAEEPAVVEGAEGDHSPDASPATAASSAADAPPRLEAPATRSPRPIRRSSSRRRWLFPSASSAIWWASRGVLWCEALLLAVSSPAADLGVCVGHCGVCTTGVCGLKRSMVPSVSGSAQILSELPFMANMASIWFFSCALAVGSLSGSSSRTFGLTETSSASGRSSPRRG
mmetsp:Transcript_50038/g.99437  ORF Transcript_50038/g.99437 Transcript_50038/m.99437 type:complete len:221 (+) Transcript_50038:1254-1916(+)